MPLMVEGLLTGVKRIKLVVLLMLSIVFRVE